MPAVLAGAFADLATVQAAEGLALVELAGTGVSRKPINGYDNSRGIADLVFDKAPARLLGPVSPSSVMQKAAVVVAAEQLGGAEACMEMARGYANTRHAFGQPIGKFQAIKHKIAEMYVANQIARANVLEAALRHDRGLPGFAALAAAARISATEAYDFAAREATQIHGGIGVTWESDLHLHMRRARSLASALGPRLLWEDQLVSSLRVAS